MTTLRASGRTDIGQVRENNEDVIVSTDRLVLVADGMGGHPGWRDRSGYRCGCGAGGLHGPISRRTRSCSACSELGDPESCARSAWAGGYGHHDLCRWTPYPTGHLALVHVGDSRAYLWREGSLIRLTEDHSITAELYSSAASYRRTRHFITHTTGF